MTQNLQLRVTAKRLIAESIVQFDLKSPVGGKLPTFSAGAHLQFELPGGIKRAYSLCNAPGNDELYQIAVQRDVNSRGGSVAMHDQVQVGHLMSTSSPQNLFPLDETATHTVLIAGGIGITPLLSMAQRLQILSKSWEMHYTSRNAARCAFKNQLESGDLAQNVTLYFDQGENAPFDVEVLLKKSSKNSHVYVCGPSGLIDLVLEKAIALGWTKDQLHFERFGQSLPAPTTERSFKVTLARSGMTLEVPPHRSILQVVLEAGVDLPVSCEQGICGTCLTDVISGTPDHRDQCLDDGMRSSSFTPCCSRSLDDELVIDL